MASFHADENYSLPRMSYRVPRVFTMCLYHYTGYECLQWGLWQYRPGCVHCSPGGIGSCALQNHILRAWLFLQTGFRIPNFLSRWYITAAKLRPLFRWVCLMIQCSCVLYYAMRYFVRHLSPWLQLLWRPWFWPFDLQLQSSRNRNIIEKAQSRMKPKGQKSPQLDRIMS